MTLSSLALAALLVEGLCPTYVRSRVDTGGGSNSRAHCLYWKGGEIAWTQAEPGNAETTGDTEFTAISQSFKTWNDQAEVCGNFTFAEKLPRTFRRDVAYDPSSSDNQNLVVFRSSRCADKTNQSDSCWTNGDCNNRYDCWQYAGGTIALTTTTYDRTTGQIYDADLELNDWGFTFTTVDAPECNKSGPLLQSCVATDVENTVTHEVGHMLGLDHSPDPESTMYASAPVGETKKRSLDQCSKEFICDVYPKGRPSRDCIIVNVSGGRTDGVADLGDVAGCNATSAGPLVALAVLLFRRRRA